MAVQSLSFLGCRVNAVVSRVEHFEVLDESPERVNQDAGTWEFAANQYRGVAPRQALRAVDCDFSTNCIKLDPQFFIGISDIYQQCLYENNNSCYLETFLNR